MKRKRETDAERDERLRAFFDQVGQLADQTGARSEEELNKCVDLSLLQSGDLREDFKTYSGVTNYGF